VVINIPEIPEIEAVKTRQTKKGTGYTLTNASFVKNT
jgi:hypothetical protein